MATKDPQIKLVYSWEEKMGWIKNTIGFAKACQLIKKACFIYGIRDLPDIQLHATRALPWCDPEKNKISMQRDRYMNVSTALHEATHYIVWQLYGCKPQDHGPTFMRIYLDLLKRNGMDVHDSAAEHGLKWW